MVFDPSAGWTTYQIVKDVGQGPLETMKYWSERGEKRYKMEQDRQKAELEAKRAEREQALYDQATQLGGSGGDVNYDQLIQLALVSGDVAGAARIRRLKDQAAAERERVVISREKAARSGRGGGGGTGAPAAPAAPPSLRISETGEVVPAPAPLPPTEPLAAPAPERKPVAEVGPAPAGIGGGPFGAAVRAASTLAAPPPSPTEPGMLEQALAPAARLAGAVSGLEGTRAAMKAAMDAFQSSLQLADPATVPPDVKAGLASAPAAPAAPYNPNAPMLVTINERPDKPAGSPATPEQERAVFFGQDYQTRNPVTGRAITKHEDGLYDLITKSGKTFTSRDIRSILARQYGAAPGPNFPENLVFKGDKVYVVGPDGRSAAVGNADALFNVLKAGFDPSLMVTEGAGGKLNVQPFPGSQKRGDEYAPEKAAATVEEAVAKDLLSAIRASGDIMNDKGQVIADLMVQSLPANVDRKLRARLGKVPEGMVDRIVAAVKREYGAALAPAANTGAAGGAYIAEGAGGVTPSATPPAPSAPRRYTMDELRKGLQALPRQ